MIFCAAIESRTSLNPVTPIPIAPAPNATRITLAAIPPYANNFFITCSFRRPFLRLTFAPAAGRRHQRLR